MVSQSQPRCTYVELPSKSGKVLCFLILVVCGCVIYFFPFGCKFINMCYFNYVECNFDVALPLFLYVLILLLLIEVELIYNVVLASGVQQSDAVLYTYIFFCRFFSITGYYKILNIVPVPYSRSLLFIYFIYSSLYLFIPSS